MDHLESGHNDGKVLAARAGESRGDVTGKGKIGQNVPQNGSRDGTDHSEHNSEALESKRRTGLK